MSGEPGKADSKFKIPDSRWQKAEGKTPLTGAHCAPTLSPRGRARLEFGGGSRFGTDESVPFRKTHPARRARLLFLHLPGTVKHHFRLALKDADEASDADVFVAVLLFRLAELCAV